MKALIKKFAAAIIAVATMFGIAGLGTFTANAAGTDGTITVNTSTSFAGELKLYQMFTATVTGTNNDEVAYKLNDAWKPFFTSDDTTTTPGTNYVEYTDTTGTKVTVDQQAVKYINSLTEAQRADFANLAKKWAAANNVTPDKTSTGANGNKTYTFDSLANGYYIIAPADAQVGQDGKYQALLVNLTDTDHNVSISLKHEFPTVDKTVNNQHASENKIGDKVDYKLTSKVPDMHEYNLGYTFNFSDTLSKGLTLLGSDDNEATKDTFEPVVKILGSINPDQGKTYKTLVKGTDYTVSVSHTDADGNPIDGTSIGINMIDFRTKHQNDAGKTITVEYSAKLNSAAVIGKDGNTNEAKVEYSNNPSNTGTGTSIPSEVRTHTFGFTIDKYTGKLYNESSERLGGATFKVYADNNGTAADKALKFDITEAGDGTKQAVAQYAGDDKQDGTNTATYTDELVTPKYGRIQVGGLKAGTYWVAETQAPAGYNKLAGKIKVVISATYDTDNGKVDGTTTNGGTGKLTSWNVVYTGSDKKDHTIKGEPPVIPVQNQNTGNHPTLPSTGGIGTVLFTVFGVLIVALGTAWYVKSNRKSSKHTA
ncbi:SpaH/EbpB family LPXTG-anchored major pilin [Bifidobacterium scaligerum]|uniref:Cell surface protein n=1 Tax=Bifidobacterium scaligerum TaxID=2052656 RepID=A0A2M9HQX6_9BIFI|nr:SpaH/EbpB family LPXTG-anchored major pilin [Bifidobacterium scaligerum]PJM79218.1 cell surface protein [Bifidobacterium scaligerum]